MNMLAWETEVQRHRDMQCKAQAFALGEIALAANRQRRKVRFLQLYHNFFTWLRKHLPTGYNQQAETLRRAQTIAQADPPMR